MTSFDTEAIPAARPGVGMSWLAWRFRGAGQPAKGELVLAEPGLFVTLCTTLRVGQFNPHQPAAFLSGSMRCGEWQRASSMVAPFPEVRRRRGEELSNEEALERLLQEG